MIIDDKSRDETLQYDINTQAAKVSALSSGKIDKKEYLPPPPPPSPSPWSKKSNRTSQVYIFPSR